MSKSLTDVIYDALPDCFADEQPDWWYRDAAAHIAKAIASRSD